MHYVHLDLCFVVPKFWATVVAMALQENIAYLGSVFHVLFHCCILTMISMF